MFILIIHSFEVSYERLLVCEETFPYPTPPLNDTKVDREVGTKWDNFLYVCIIIHMIGSICVIRIVCEETNENRKRTNDKHLSRYINRKRFGKPRHDTSRVVR